ncbi:XkdX family protein [Geomicrobium sediminis]|uniref:XkdX family protein n=1 Tax=Geomicrobium sediminis TaxID=1347788 RepID=A0ABS2PFQ9_9BACL|nr:XkdX family protein [Geomicrobium sediminis]MBM7633816.1 hypothetical protein [Geomicrobium sediminis]
MWFDRIDRFYNTVNNQGGRLWEIDRVVRAVECNNITEAEFEEITGINYQEHINAV